ncbi:chemotaxis protein [Vibrio sp. TRT 1302]|uniref:chemotaxis protein n=1 Tax=Vibrio sp. TRT 1302 TaxID=3418504 RepID=UPI003CE70C1D
MARKHLFIVAAEVSAELNRGVLIAKQLQLVASNARALALRAGDSAAGFHPITDSIDGLVRLTLTTSSAINHKAQELSKVATAAARASEVLNHFESVYHRAKDAEFLSSLDSTRTQCHREFERLNLTFSKDSKQLYALLHSLYSELRVARIISTMLSVEASQVEERFKDQLNAIAESVQEFAEAIREHVLQSLKLFSLFDKENYAIKSSI